jgi:hypothetical protein
MGKKWVKFSSPHLRRQTLLVSDCDSMLSGGGFVLYLYDVAGANSDRYACA